MKQKKQQLLKRVVSTAVAVMLVTGSLAFSGCSDKQNGKSNGKVEI